jgi:precorrin-2 dehydrogenase/sirohydrochlorin ferrochelatase
MEYLPIILNIKDKKFLVVGGGNIAFEKINRLTKFTHNITIVSPNIKNELYDLIQKYNLEYIKSEYVYGMLDNFDIVIVAADNLKLQKSIYHEAKSKGKLCNSVDMAEYSDFIFPSIVKKGNFLLSFSTSGTSPALAKYLRKFFEEIIPDEIEKFLEEMETLRNQLPKGKERQELMDKLAKEFVEKYFKKQQGG